MKLKLTSDDRNAIDLLLNHATSGMASHSYAAATGEEHVHAVRSVLQLLQVLPTSAPPAGLAARTLMNISRATGQATAAQIAAAQITGAQTGTQAHNGAERQLPPLA